MRRSPLTLTLAAAALAVTVAACGGGDDDEPAAPEPTGDGSSLTVHATDSLRFDKTSYAAKAGEIDVTYINDGSIVHTLLVKDVDDFKLEVGEEDQGTIELEKGTYELYCDVAGHSGMKATFIVE